VSVRRLPVFPSELWDGTVKVNILLYMYDLCPTSRCQCDPRQKDYRPTFSYPSCPSYVGQFCLNRSRPHGAAPLAEIAYAPLGSGPGLGSTSPAVAAGPNRKSGNALCSLLV
jgi:hypothetical protein